MFLAIDGEITKVYRPAVDGTFGQIPGLDAPRPGGATVRVVVRSTTCAAG